MLYIIGASIYILFMLFYDCKRIDGGLFITLLGFTIPSYLTLYMLKYSRSVVIRNGMIYLSDWLGRQEVFDKNEFLSITSAFVMVQSINFKPNKSYLFNLNNKYFPALLTHSIKEDNANRYLTTLVQEYLNKEL